MNHSELRLDHLPVELLYEIHTFALSPALPLACKRLHAVIKSAPTAVHADYLIGCYEEAAAQSASARAFGFVSRILRFPLCTRGILEAVFRSPTCPSIPAKDDIQKAATVLPRRLFRSLAPRDDPGQRPWTEDDEPLPFLRFLCEHERVPSILTDSYEGYALTRAVYAAFTPLIRFLLAHGASPECKGALAVTVAIRRKSLPLVRMLIERDGPQAYVEKAAAQTGSKKRKRLSAGDSHKGACASSDDSGPSRGAKRRKLGDRVVVTQDMLKTAVKCDARDIVEYFTKEKGCVPDMQTVLMMSR
ncbi:hypothetical protein C8Q80DRAFT_1101312 [Daedaleopsis nitida]|nr:hypothetical protein C8Q80DRAFT_1101312 [Daedaleopsis nitida]